MPVRLSDQFPYGHLCSIYDLQTQSAADAELFLSGGLSQNEKCVHIADASQWPRLRDRRAGESSVIHNALAVGQMVWVSLPELFLKQDPYDLYRVLVYLKNLATAARREGFRGLRVVIDMSWLRQTNASPEQVREYEQRLTDLAESMNCIWFCQYPRQSSAANELMHPAVVHKGVLCPNLHHKPGEAVSCALTLEQLLETLYREVERTLKVTHFGELAAAIAHEMRQPLMSMTTEAHAALRWLAQPQPNLTEARASLQHIAQSGHRAGAVITSIEALVRQEVRFEQQLDMNEVIVTAVALLEKALHDNRVQLRLELDPALPLLYGHRVQLEQVMLNLITNASDAITARSSSGRDILVRSWMENVQQVRVSVRDSGIGVDDSAAQGIFKPFVTTKPQGMGVGLSISQAIIHAHNGRLWVSQNEDGKPGATFHITLNLGAPRPE